jgi:hypothetical protein
VKVRVPVSTVEEGNSGAIKILFFSRWKIIHSSFLPLFSRKAVALEILFILYILKKWAPKVF